MKVLLATDSSACSQIAIASVLGMKWADNTEFKVVTVVGLFEPLQMVDEIQDDEILLAKKYIASVVDEVKAALPQTKVTGDVLVGHTDFIIKQTAAEFDADLIVVGSHGRRGLSRFLLGSVSRGVLIGAPCAVRIVRQPDVDNAPAINHVLIALDNTAHSAHTLDHVIQSPWPDGTKFKCISVIRQDYPFVFLDPMNVPGIPIELPDMRKNVSLSLEQAVARLDGAFGQGSANCQVLVGDPREEILEAAKKWSASLIMLGSHGHKLMETVFLGSVSDAVAAHAHCSVEVTRLPAKTPATTTAI
jgi:nucleotide-binding universal stress UspA family protein